MGRRSRRELRPYSAKLCVTPSHLRQSERAARLPSLILNALTAGGFATGRGVTVGVVDSGWDRTLLDPRVAAGWSLVDSPHKRSRDDHDILGHGTMCTKVLLEVAPGCTIVPIRVFGDRLETTPQVLIESIELACSLRVRVLNLSLGTTRTEFARALFAACRRASELGVILVAAAKSAPTSLSFPAAFEPVLGVGSAYLGDRYAVRYTDGAAVECAAHCVAPRHRRKQNAQNDFASGSSFAAPVVSGLVTRLLQKHPDLSICSLRKLLSLGVPSN